MLNKSIFFTIAMLLSAYMFGQKDSLQFPASWQGEWVGELVIHSGAEEMQRLPMILRMLPLNDSTYSYTIVYGEDTPENTRPYYLQTVDRTIGHYHVNEDNSIILDEFFINNKLYSRFEVMGNLLLATIEKRDDQLIYEIISGPLEPINITGDTIINDEEIPPVASYKINVQQRAILSKN